jgi:iron(III) transport system ATP-binding protein
MLTVAALCTEYAGQNGAAVKAAQDVTFDVADGKFFTLLGPSGCGKTTTLRSIAGLERPVSGEIVVDGLTVFSSRQRVFLPPNKRRFGMVFQSYAIWPHMNVFQNVSFPLEVAEGRLPKEEIRARVMRVLAAVALDHLAEREATKLSGGQQQRLALARALVMEPKLLLLDEPLSNLDAKLREKMRFELKRMQSEFKITTIYVTHDQSEALALSDEIAVMNEGRIVQLARPREIYERPLTKFVADFIGTTNFLDGKVIGGGAGETFWSVDTRIGVLKVRSERPLPLGSSISVSIRPEDVHLSDAERPAESVNSTEAMIEQVVFLGEHMDLKLRLGEQEILARGHPSMNAAPGRRIHMWLNPDKCIAVAAE